MLLLVSASYDIHDPGGVGVDVAVELGVADAVGLGVPLGVCVAAGVGHPGVVLGVGVGPTGFTGTQAENSDVLPLGSVAVAVITWPEGTLTRKVTDIGAVQLPSVVTSVEPMKVSPEPLPEGWHRWLSKNSIL